MSWKAKNKVSVCIGTGKILHKPEYNANSDMGMRDM
jgi:hypothetical protein